jgi:hypothetical protein
MNSVRRRLPLTVENFASLSKPGSGAFENFGKIRTTLESYSGKSQQTMKSSF